MTSYDAKTLTVQKSHPHLVDNLYGANIPSDPRKVKNLYSYKMLSI
jgi:hypothetical protein